jgi:tetratricopeptide (TPR) repeat protein
VNRRLSGAIRASLLSLSLAAAGAAGCAGSGAQISAGPEGADAATLAALGDSALAAGSPGRARALYERAGAVAASAGDTRNEARAAVGVGRYLALARRYHDARVQFERAAALDTLSAAPFYYLARASLDLGDEKLALRALATGLRRDPDDAASAALFQSLARARCTEAGLPPEYAELPLRSSVTRGELGVMIAVELGLDPDRLGWASDRPQIIVPPEADGTWGARWLKASVLRGYVRAFPDGSLHLADPVTRGALALSLAMLERNLGLDRRAATPPGYGAEVEGTSESPAAGDSTAAVSSASAPRPAFPDLGARSYLRRAAARAVALGLPTHLGGVFDASANATGADVLRVLDRLAREAGRTSAVPPELRQTLVVQ